MKKFILMGLLVGLMASTASAHHMAKADIAGDEIVEWSPHLDMVF